MTAPNTAASSLEHRIGARGRFTLRQPAGEIAIRGVEGDVARVRDLEDRPLTDSFEIVAAEGSLELRAIDRLGSLVGLLRRGPSPNLAVEVPHGAAVTIEAASADVAASDLTGEKQIRTASGAVSLVRLAGAVEVVTVSGEIEIDGQVQLEVLGRTVSGDLSLRLPATRRLDVGTTSGDLTVDAELQGEGPFEVRTISGDATIVARGGLRIEAQTVTGDVDVASGSVVESTRGRKVVTIGRSGPTLTFRSVSGDLAVVKATETGAPATPPAADASAGASAGAVAEPMTADDGRLAILRALERGEISVSDAGQQLSELEEVAR